jgi:hypothetical protein
MGLVPEFSLSQTLQRREVNKRGKIERINNEESTINPCR